MSSKLKKKKTSKPASNNSTIVVGSHFEGFKGPIPPPEILRDYENIKPGFAERIIAMAEREQNHRHDIENKLVISEIKNTKLGLIFAFIIGISAIFSGTYILLNGYKLGGSVLSGIAAITLVGYFIKAVLKSRK